MKSKGRISRIILEKKVIRVEMIFSVDSNIKLASIDTVVDCVYNESPNADAFQKLEERMEKFK